MEFLVITAGIFLTSYIKVTLAGIFAERIDQIFAFQNRVFSNVNLDIFTHSKILTCRSNIISIIKQLWLLGTNHGGIRKKENQDED